ncbi:Simple sugar transport system ATP-binding protein OS=Castellaniella defragrans OX=75697 GN=HNR28_002644 PE=4 SV=1 [Castellaniella defragrans]
MQSPDGGVLRVHGREVTFHNSLQAAAAGIAAVFQELSLCPHLTVAENIMLGHEPTGAFGQISMRRCREVVHALFQRLGITHLSPDTLVERLALADRQLVEIAKALAHDPDTLIVDEGTSALGREEVVRLFGVLDDLRAEGKAIIFISHRMAEVRGVADRMTVFRNGTNAGTFTAGDVTDAELIEIMLGRPVQQSFPARAELPGDTGPLLEVRLFTVGDALRDVSFTVRAGEVVGIAGMDGQGQGEVLLTLFGALRRPGGEVRVRGRRVRLGSPWRSVRGGFVLIPEDRRSQGLVQAMPLRANITLASLAKVLSFGLISAARERDVVRQGIERVQIKTVSMGTARGRAQRRQSAEGRHCEVAAGRRRHLHVL